MTKQASQRVSTPKGELQWVTIDGDGKENDFNGKMQYLASIVLDAADPFIKKINTFWEENKPEKYKKDPKSLGYSTHRVPTGEKDEDGKNIYEDDETKVSVRFTTSTTYPDGKPKVIEIRNARDNVVKLPSGVQIGNGTIGRIGGTMKVYTNATKSGSITDAGVSFFLDRIQILKLEEYQQDSGFEAEDDGWTGDDNSFEGDPVESTTDSSDAKPRL